MRSGLLQISNGPYYAVGLKAPTLTSSFQVTLPSALPGVTSGLQIDTSGNLGFFTPNTGTVQSVGLTAPSLFTVSGAPVTTSGSLGLTLASQSANLIFASPIGASGAPTFRGLATTDFSTLPTLNAWASPTSSLNLNGQTITNGGNPVNATDYVIKSYVDAQSQGLKQKDSCRYISILNIASIATATAATVQAALDTVGGTAPTLATNDRILVAFQSTGAENGIYVWNGTALVRSQDANTNALVVQGIYVFVGNGDEYGSNGFVMNTPNPITLGTTGLNFTEFSGAGDIKAGNGITKPTPNTIAVKPVSTTRLTSATGGIDLATTGVTAGSTSGITYDAYGRITGATQPAYASVYRTAFTSASLSSNILTVTHNLGQQYVSCDVSDNNNQQLIPDNITFSSTTQLTVDLTSFNTSGISGNWHVVCVG